MGARIAGVALSALMVLGGSTPAYPQHGGVTGQALDVPAQPPTPTSQRPAMMQRHAQMMADMKKADAELASLVAKMNGAPAAGKADAIAAVVNELVRRQREMHERMARMQCMTAEEPAPEAGTAEPHKH